MTLRALILRAKCGRHYRAEAYTANVTKNIDAFWNDEPIFVSCLNNRFFYALRSAHYAYCVFR